MASGGSGQAAASEVRSRSACAGGTVPPCCRVIEIDDLRRGQTLLLGGHAPPPPALLHHIAPSVLRGPASNPSTPVRLADQVGEPDQRLGVGDLLAIDQIPFTTSRSLAGSSPASPPARAPGRRCAARGRALFS